MGGRGITALILGGVLLLAAGQGARADRILGADDYLDRLRGMWLGEILGNYAGRPVEGQVARGGLTYDVPWSTLIATDPWTGDDDTCFEYLYAGLLGAETSPTGPQVRQAWEDHVPLPSFYIANKQARWLMSYGLTPPETGSLRYNICWWAIDSQITTEAVGAAAPGMRQQAADLAATFARTTNDGFAVHAAQFYAVMYAAAPFETDVETLIAKGLEMVPATSRTHEVVQDVRDWFAADQGDGALDWRATQAVLYDKYAGADSHGRYRGWVESAVNTGLTTLALLYGQGEFVSTVEIAVQAGFDCDCNPATAGGLIGLMKGYAGLPADLTAAATDTYVVQTLTGLVTDTAVSQVALDWQAAAERQILAAGGTIEGTDEERVYRLPDADPVTPPPERPDPAGPAGLVPVVRALGGTVTPASSAGVNDPANDRKDLRQIIDGVTDLSYSGRLAYTTDDGENAQPPGGDWYQIGFGREVTLTSVVFTEGDIRPVHSNYDPREVEPRGGYFLNLVVEVGRGGVFTPVSNLKFSEPLDPFTYFQQIELAFDPIAGDAVRIRGDAGGTWQFTSIVELEARGCVDLAAGHAVADYEAGASPLADVTAWVRSGYRDGPGGYWDGPGIASSAAASDPDGLTAVGVLDNTDPKVGGKTTFEGETVDATAVLVKYTWWGDANLDGVVDANDYDVIDTGYLFPPAPADMGWWTGDFTYDGRIDANDYDRIDRAYLFQTGPLAAGGAAAPAATPEPATLALLALGGLGLLGRRRRTR